MKKAVLLLLALCFILVVVVGCAGPELTGGAAGTDGTEEPDVVYEPDDVYEIDEPEDLGSDETFDDVHIVLPGEGEDYDFTPVMSEYTSVTGEITFINVDGDGTQLTINSLDRGEMTFALTEETVFPFSEEFDVGDTVTGWFLSAAPMALIYPPPPVEVAVLSAGMPDGSNIKVDRFDVWEDHDGDYFISQDGMFAFTIDDDTEIILADGQEFTINECAGRRIVVIYGMSTRSIPEMATANKLIVLFESITPFG